jgi:hypothetical protein
MTNLPTFSETLESYGIKFKPFYKALCDYLDLAHEVMYSADAQADPHEFLRRSDEYRELRAFQDIMERQYLLECFLDADEEDSEEEEEVF